MTTMHISLHVKYPLFGSDFNEFNETWIFRPIFEKYSTFEFHRNSSSGSRLYRFATSRRCKQYATFWGRHV